MIFSSNAERSSFQRASSSREGSSSGWATPANFGQLELASQQEHHPEDGISSSVKIGLNASLDADAVLFTVSDQPWLTSETICELIHVFLNTSKGIACVSCQGKMGNPCIFDRKYYNELLSLEGDKGGKKVIMKHLDDTQIYEIEAGRELEDIDYCETYSTPCK